MMRSSPRFAPSCLPPIPSGLARAVLLFGLLIIPVDGYGQSENPSGTVYVTNWPESRPENASRKEYPAFDAGRFNMLPFIDTLAVQYRFSSTGARPSMHFSIEWTLGAYGILNGQRVDASALPDGVAIESIDLLMPVLSEDELVAEFFLPLDTVDLGPSPSITFVDVAEVSWDSVFVDVPAVEAQAFFTSGFRLGQPRILRVVFAVVATEPEHHTTREPRYPLSRPRERTVCIPDADVWVAWSGGRSRWVPPPKSITKADRDRRGEIGRTALVDRSNTRRGFTRPGSGDPESMGPEREGSKGTADDRRTREERESGGEDNARTDRKSGRSGGGGIADLVKPKNDDDDDDEDDRLYPAALAGVAAVGGVALFGGTIGYFGSASDAPIGLMSGYVESHGGFLLQVAINRQVFGKARGPENLIASVTAFHSIASSPIQPAVGLGVRFTEEGSETVARKASISLGLVGNFGPLVLLTGYDVVSPDFRFGIAINLRQLTGR